MARTSTTKGGFSVFRRDGLLGERHIFAVLAGRSNHKWFHPGECFEIIPKFRRLHWLLRAALLLMWRRCSTARTSRQPRLQRPGWPGASEQSEFHSASSIAMCFCGLSGIPPRLAECRTCLHFLPPYLTDLPTAQAREDDILVAAGYQPFQRSMYNVTSGRDPGPALPPCCFPLDDSRS